MPFWRNPEFIRYCRAQLRPGHIMTAASITLAFCGLVALMLHTLDNRDQFSSAYYFTLMVIQYVILALWCASTCGQSLSRERELRTFDSWRTTRLTPVELLVGLVLGRPIMAFFVVGCSLPISVSAGLWAGYSLGVIAQTYLIMVAAACFVSLFGLCVSMLSEKSSSGSAPGLVLLFLWMSMVFAATPFPGLAALSGYPAVYSLYAPGTISTDLRSLPFFGVPSSPVLLTLILYGAFGAWLVVMLIRNLKKSVDEVRLLSPWLAVGFAAFLNVLLYALWHPEKLPSDISSMVIGLNLFILYIVGLFTLTPRERLTVWWRKRSAGEAALLSEDGPPWPWPIMAGGACYILLVIASQFVAGPSSLGKAAVQLLVLLAFTTRDILFLQWCTISTMKRRVGAGVLYLAFYYFGALILVSVASTNSQAATSFVLSLLTPLGAFTSEEIGLGTTPGLFLGMGLQLFAIAVLLKGLSTRLQRPPIVLAPSAS